MILLKEFDRELLEAQGTVGMIGREGSKGIVKIRQLELVGSRRESQNE